MESQTRRRFLKLTGSGLLAAPIVASGTLAMPSALSVDDKPKAPVKARSNPVGVSLNVRDFGAVGNGVAKDTQAIQQAIDRCWVLGGGEVMVPVGEYLTGSIGLRSNVTLRLEENAVIKGSDELADYLIAQVRWEGKWRPGYVGLIYAFDAENIGIVGKGKVAGSDWVGGRPTPENPLRRPALIEPINCKQIYFDGFSTDYHLMWSIHPTYCEQVTIQNLTIRSTGGNGDGIDVDSCRHVAIDHCDILTGDDCIAIKSGRGMEAYQLRWTTDDVRITHCTFGDSLFACVGIGSEGSGGIRNVRIEHCKFVHAKTHAVYIKSRPGRGAFYENIFVDDIDVSGTEGGFLRFNTLGSGIQDEDPVPGFDGIPWMRNFRFTNIRVVDVPVLVDGTSFHPDKPLDGFVLKNVSGTCAKGIRLANIRNADLDQLNVTGYEGPLIGIINVKGKGLKQAVPIDAPEIKPPIPEPAVPYLLK